MFWQCLFKAEEKEDEIDEAEGECEQSRADEEHALLTFSVPWEDGTDQGANDETNREGNAD